jgi:hypothetical protein
MRQMQMRVTPRAQSAILKDLRASGLPSPCSLLDNVVKEQCTPHHLVALSQQVINCSNTIVKHNVLECNVVVFAPSAGL